ncbi:MAG: dihydroorotate dehydrogenase electron transfer subunit [Bacteroidales bacterium]|jgi:dihydroorotate dehydrogenase electron transfer subunit|nr:dihydroorotate dehydrogenase electron transfer subunit [Bacteroidales bacterium]
MKYCSDFVVADKVMLENNFFRLALKSKSKLPSIIPGQFVQVLTTENNGNNLRLPISINDICEKNNIIYLLIQIIGEGTRTLSRVEIGERVNMIYPLGNGFDIAGDKVLFVGGGVGIAPFLHLAKAYHNNGIKPDVLIGARTDKHLLLLDEFKPYAELHITTEDGSMGTKGFVTAHPIFNTKFDRIYSCGPTPMMKVVADKAKQHNIPCWVSLEERMACGIGACLCCVVMTNEGHKCTCTDGTVFNAADLTDF